MTAKLSTKDLDAALAVIREASAADGDHPFELPVIDQLTRLVPADQAGYFEYRLVEPCLGRDIHVVKQLACADEIDFRDEEVGTASSEWALRDSLRGVTTGAVRFSDVIPNRQRRLRNAWYATV